MPQLAAILLAAGEGTRMKSAVPKVMHALGGKPLLNWVVQAARAAGAAPVVAVLGHGAEHVQAILPAGVQSVRQRRPLGTADAVLAARAALAGRGGDILVLCGDAPLLRARTLRRLVAEHRRRRAAATMLTAVLADPTGYGRVVRVPADPGAVARIVEEKDAGASERRISEVNSGAYVFRAAALWPALARVQNRNRKREFYLTDIIGILHARGQRVAARGTEDPEEILGINSRRDLAAAERICNRRTLEALMDAGVTVLDPGQTWIEAGVRIGRDTVILPGTRITGDSVIGRGCVLGPAATIDASRLGAGVKVRSSAVEGSRVGARVRIGPYSHLRAGTTIAPGVYIGNFAETNRSRVGRNAKMGHVCYVGDALVGENVNIGAGTITANFDGVNKHPTRIGKNAFLGSGTILVAPVWVGPKAMTGAGAVVKRNSRIPAGMLAVGVPARVIKARRSPAGRDGRPRARH